MLVKRSFSWGRPQTTQEAWEMLQEKRSALIGGGTDILPLMRYGLVAPQRLISLEGIKELSQLTWWETAIFIGSTVTLTQLAEQRRLSEEIPVLAEASLKVASPQIRNIATLGGNIFQSKRCIYFNQTSSWRRGIKPCLQLGGAHCYQAPRGKKCLAIYHSDISPALVALGAEAVYYSDGKYRVIKVIDALEHTVDWPQRFHGHNGHHQELCIGFFISQAMKGALCRFYKYSIRGALDFALANFACVLLPREQEQKLIISVGAIAPQPLLLKKTAAVSLASIRGGHGDPSRIEQAAMEELAEKSSLIKDSGVSVSARRSILALVAKELASTICHWSKNQQLPIE